jgi:two-component system OmpR family sensor kinase
VTTPPGAGRRGTVSLRRRVTVATVAVFAVVLVAATAAVDASFSVIVERSVTAVLTDHVQLAEQLAAQNTPPVELVDRLETRSVRARLVLANGHVLGSLRPGLPGDDAAKGRRIRLANVSGPLAGAQLTLEVDGRLLSAARTRLVRVLILIAAAAVVLIAVGTPIAVRLALSPLDAMTRLAHSIAGGRRGQRFGPPIANTELGRTATAFDEMLDALEGAERRALASEESMRRFVADAAHELRTPVAGIAAAAEAVLQQPGDADVADRHRLLLLLGREAQRAGRLVEDLLDLARIDTGLSLRRQGTELRALVEGQVERARLLYPTVSLRVEGPPVTAAVDGARIGQVVTNLLNNACGVTPAGGVVRVELSRSGGTAAVAVCDAGPGVVAQDREQIFARLVHTDTPRNRRGEGAGLGLTIARGIARAHGGDLVCLPSPPAGRGAVFLLTLPVAG